MAQYTPDQLQEISRLDGLRKLLVETNQRVNRLNRQILRLNRDRQRFVDRRTRIQGELQKIAEILEPKGGS